MREPSDISARYAWYAVGVLCLVTAVNYACRYVVSPLLAPIQAEFGLSDAALGSLGTAFVVVYALTAVPFGRLSDVWVRKYIIAIGMAACAMATMASATSRRFGFLLVTRGLVGIGEAMCLPSAIAIISDYVGSGRRARGTAVVAAGMLMGGALGIGGGGALREAFDWRSTFWIVGAPGIGVAVLVAALREPAKGWTEDVQGAERAPTPPMRTLLRVPTFWILCAGITLLTAATGGLLHWMPIFLEKARGLAAARGVVAGASATMAGCLVGAVSSGWVADRLADRMRGAHVLLIGLGLLGGAPAMLLFVTSNEPGVYMTCLAIAGFFLTWPLPPMGALLYAVVEPKLRATAVALFTFIIHVAGDAASPLLIGRLSDIYRLRGVAEPENLRLALLSLPACCVLGGVVCLAALRTVGRDVDAMQQRLAEQTRRVAEEQRQRLHGDGERIERH
ncbi:MAG: MFS transporter [Armatimonadota bacterium]|jgi:MFS family permease